MGKHQSVLKTSYGTYVVLVKGDKQLKLSTQDIQGGIKNVPKVFIYRKNVDSDKQVAFCWKHDQQYYTLKVQQKMIMLHKTEAQPKSRSLDNSCWFWKKNILSSKYQGLECAGEPGWFLCTEEDNVYISQDSEAFEIKGV